MFIFDNKFFKRILTFFLSLLGLLLILIFANNGIIRENSNQSILSILFNNPASSNAFHVSVSILVTLILYIGGIVTTSLIQFSSTKNKPGIIGSAISLASSLVLLIIDIIYFQSFKSPGLPIFTSILEGIKLAYLIMCKIKSTDVDIVESTVDLKKLVIINIILVVISLLSLIILFFIPIYSINGINSNTLFDSFTNTSNLSIYIGFVSFFFLYVALVILISQNLMYVNKDKQNFCKKSRTSLFYCLGFSVIYYIYSVVLLFIQIRKETAPIESSYTLAYIPFIIEALTLVFNSIVSAKYEDNVSKTNFKISNRIIVLIFSTLFIVIANVALTSNIIKVTYIINNTPYARININGFEILKNYKNMSEGFESIAFLIYLSMMVSAIFLVSNITLFFRKSTEYYKVSLISIIVTYLLLFALSLFGKYYEIAEQIHKESIESLLETYNLNINASYTYKIDSETMPYFIAGTILLIAMFIVRPFSNQYKEDAIDVNITNDNQRTIDTNTSNEISNSINEQNKDYDQCPAFSEIDKREDEFINIYHEKLKYSLNEPNLNKICSFVVEYAKNSRLHLSYTKEDIATFIAGLGSTRLEILQGMSGTGKTSLPKIFAEAILGNVNIIEVESSWKDKNELIGYYNEFSEKFTPKKFTQALYEAKFRSDEITFIVLDEMNLSRIEYYFSDFLSLMENEEDKRNIKLLNTSLSKSENGVITSYKMLEHGHTLYIPKNVFFIGTANRDESTFEISDKVYDRANTINFNKRAKKIRDYQDPIEPRFISYTTFNTLINRAKELISFDAENNDLIKSCEELLIPYNISFGNRILNQMESFVKVYVSCFDNPNEHINEAVEKILLSKVVAKLEYKSVENKDELKDKFSRLGLYECAHFVEKLNEDF